MNRQKREEALRNSQPSGKPGNQPGRSNSPDRERMRASEEKLPERQQPHREPGKLPLPD